MHTKSDIEDLIIFFINKFGFLKFGNDWDICMCINQAYEGHRFRDWLAWDDPDLCYNVDGYDHRIALVPYSYNKKQYMQISGFWWAAKK